MAYGFLCTVVVLHFEDNTRPITIPTWGNNGTQGVTLRTGCIFLLFVVRGYHWFNMFLNINSTK